MDTNTVIVIALLAVIVVAAFLVYRRRAKVEITGPLGTGLKLDASDEQPLQPSTLSVEDITSREGGLAVEDSTGDAAAFRRVDVKDDIIIQRSKPKTDADPKA